MLLFCKQDMVGDALQDLPAKGDALTLSPRTPSCSRSHLGHELQAPFDAGKRFLLQDSGLVGRDDGWVDKAQEHGASHRSDAVLWEALAHHLRLEMEGAGHDRRGRGGMDGRTKRGSFEQRERE